MITPADLAHMLGQTPNAAGNHTQDQLLYTSQTPQNSADSEDFTPVEHTEIHAEPAAEIAQPVMPTPATVFGMKATVTIATPNETIAGQTDGIAAEAEAEAMASIAIASSAAQVPSAPVTPTPATVFGRKFADSSDAEAHDAADSAPEAVVSTVEQNGTDGTNDTVDAAVSADAQSAAEAEAAPKTAAPMSAAAAMRAIAAATMHIAAPIAKPKPAPVQSVPAQPQPTQPTVAPIASPVEVEVAVESERGASASAPVSTAPTPAMMPQRRTSDGPTTFASLDAQELPVVREYSAGGLIFDNQNRVAIIARHSRSGHLEWCLPKGHIEKGETPQQTAVREVHEETGILGEVIDSIATIDYWFTGTTQRVHKLVHHFALRQTGGELTVEGDPDHEAEDAIWVRFDDLDDVLSYPNERKIAWLYARKKNRQANE